MKKGQLVMEITDKEYKILNKHRETMKTIIINRAISDIPISFREDVLELAKDKKLLNCNCNSGIFTAVSKLYNAMLEKDELLKQSKSNKKTKK